MELEEVNELPPLGESPPCPECGSGARFFRWTGENAGYIKLKTTVRYTISGMSYDEASDVTTWTVEPVRSGH
jgi:hypothetical protein